MASIHTPFFCRKKDQRQYLWTAFLQQNTDFMWIGTKGLLSLNYLLSFKKNIKFYCFQGDLIAIFNT